MLDCVHCDNQIFDPAPNDLNNLITIECPKCHRRTPTGREKSFRRYWERCIARDFPPVTAVHALGMANSIYKTAEDNLSGITMARDSGRLKKIRKAGYCQIVEQVVLRGRAHQGVMDVSAVGAVAVVANGKGAAPAHTIYVIFRGSNDASQTTLDSGHVANVDWRANLDNRMVLDGTFNGAPVMVHGGFHDILSSYRDRVLAHLSRCKTNYPDANVVVTGHSQGAAHAILFTYWIARTEPHLRPFCIPFSPPRVGNLAFARHFKMLVSDKCRVLAHDGPRFGAYLMVKGHDPVVFGVEHAFSAAPNERFKKADGGMYKAGIYATWKERLNSVPEEIYFHPPHLTQIDGFMIHNTATALLNMAGVDVQVVHHHPGLFMKKLMGGL